MNDAALFRFYRLSLSDKEEVYRFIGNIQRAKDFSEQDVVEALLSREKEGDLSAAAGVVMPHFVSEKLEESSVSLILPEKAISCWDETMKEVRLIIVLAVRRDETREVKLEIRKFVRKLVGMRFVDELLRLNTANELVDLLEKELEED